MLQLYLNDTLADLTDDSPIALTFQINNLAEVKNQQGNTSNQFKLPLTQHNRQILGFPDDVAFTNNLPYTQYAAKLVQDGMEIIPYGLAELNSVDNDTASITVLSGNVDFFDAIDGKIYEAGDKTSIWYNKEWVNYDHTWTLDNVVNSQTKTEGWIWPVVDYGKINPDNTEINIYQLRPGFFLKTAIELMVKKTGYTLNPDSFLVKDELYNKLIVQFANDTFEHGTDYQNAPDALSATVKNTRTQYTGPNEGVVQFQQIEGNYETFSLATNVFTALKTINVEISFLYNVWVRGNNKNKPAGMQVQLQLWRPATGTWGNIAFTDHGAYRENKVYAPYINQKLSTDWTLQAGEKVRVAYMRIYDSGSECYFDPGATFSVKNKVKEVIYTQTIQCERIFPDITQKDLLKDTLQRFGIICQTDNTRRMVTLASFRNIVNNIPRAKDWTLRCIDQGKAITFQLGGYAQLNYLKNKEDDNVLPKGLADSQIIIKDKTLPATGTLFESQFAPTLNLPYHGGSIAKITKVDAESGTNDFSISTQPRLLINDVLDLKQQTTITFTDGAGNKRYVNDKISVPYFDKTGAPHSLHFDKLRLQYYPELEKILHQSKKVVRYFMLSPRDILELDLLIPVYLQQDSAYYYINKIDSWRKGQPVKVELVKLG